MKQKNTKDTSQEFNETSTLSDSPFQHDEHDHDNGTSVGGSYEIVQTSDDHSEEGSAKVLKENSVDEDLNKDNEHHDNEKHLAENESENDSEQGKQDEHTKDDLSTDENQEKSGEEIDADNEASDSEVNEIDQELNDEIESYDEESVEESVESREEERQIDLDSLSLGDLGTALVKKGDQGDEEIQLVDEPASASPTSPLRTMMGESKAPVMSPSFQQHGRSLQARSTSYSASATPEKLAEKPSAFAEKVNSGSTPFSFESTAWKLTDASKQSSIFSKPADQSGTSSFAQSNLLTSSFSLADKGPTATVSFGNTTSGTTFGTSLFVQPSTFGQTSPQAKVAFGQPSMLGQTSAFSPTSTPGKSTFGAPSTFGQTT